MSTAMTYTRPKIKQNVARINLFLIILLRENALESEFLYIKIFHIKWKQQRKRRHKKKYTNLKIAVGNFTFSLSLFFHFSFVRFITFYCVYAIVRSLAFLLVHFHFWNVLDVTNRRWPHRDINDRWWETNTQKRKRKKKIVHTTSSQKIK